jgi:hypothetical protein
LGDWKGEQVGKLEATYVIAKNLLSKSLVVETAADATVLTSAEIQKLF